MAYAATVFQCREVNFKFALVGSRRPEEVERGAETILGTKPSRSAARRLPTNASALALQLPRGRTGGKMTKAGPERY